MLNKFDETLKKYLLETPWYDLMLEVPFNLRFEDAKNKEDLLKKLHSIFLDPSNRLYIKDNFEKFISAVTDDLIFKSYIKKYNCQNEVDTFFKSTLQKITNKELMGRF